MHIDHLKKWIIGAFLLFFLSYGIFESYNLITGPKINIKEPKNGDYFEKPLVELKGTARNISFISLNDKSIFVDKKGNLNEKLILSPGYNIITLKAKDRFNKSIEKKLELFLKRPDGTKEFIIGTTSATTTNKKSGVASSTKDNSVATTTKINN